MDQKGQFRKIPSKENYSERAKWWMMHSANSPIFTVSAKDRLADWIEKAERWERLVAEDPDASIILGDELMAACEELDELRTKIEVIRKIVVSPNATDLIKITDDLMEVLGPSLNNQEVGSK